MHLSSAASHDADEPWSASDLVPTWWPLARTGITVRALSRSRCLELLGTETTGRLFPLQRRTDPLEIRYRISSDLLMIDPPPQLPGSPRRRPPLVMVCVDRLDPDEMHGWSLVIVGSLVSSADGGAAPWDVAPALLDLRSLTGRSFTTSPKRHLQFAPGG